MPSAIIIGERLETISVRSKNYHQRQGKEISSRCGRGLEAGVEGSEARAKSRLTAGGEAVADSHRVQLEEQSRKHQQQQSG